MASEKKKASIPPDLPPLVEEARRRGYISFENDQITTRTPNAAPLWGAVIHS